MALSDPIPVRFSETADSGLAAISSSTGISKAELVRIAVTDFLARVAETGEIVQRIPVSGVVVVAPQGSFQKQTQISARAAETPPTPGEPAAEPPPKPVRYPKSKKPKP